MSKAFDYVKYDETATAQQASLKSKFLELESMVDGLAPGRAKVLVATKLEEAYMWVGKAIRDEQVAKRGAALEEGRGPG